MNNDRIKIDYFLTFTTSFHLGTGLRTGLIDRSVRRNAKGYLYVPGSTFKGVVREKSEQLARFLDPETKRITSPHDALNALKDLYQPTTLITDIFGSQSHPGLLFFDDAYQRKEDLKQYESSEKIDGEDRYIAQQTETYTQVRLDRITRTSVPGALYTSEFGHKNFTFAGSIAGWLNPKRIDNGPEDVSHALLLLLASCMMVNRLGGNKSTGKGECTIDIAAVKVNETEYAKEQWITWIEYLDKLKISEGEQA